MMLHLAVALDGAGWHPAAWRDPAAAPEALFSARHWAGLVAEAERGLLDFVTIEDALGPQSSLPDGFDDRTDHVRGRFDAVLLAARLAPLTSRIGLVPTATTTHTEPFHVALGIATLDHVSGGRAGWRPQVSARASDARHFGRRAFPPLDQVLNRPGGADLSADPHVRDLFAEAADAVEVARRLWDSWEDDAEIRDVATGRFIDRDKLHYIDFEGRFFSVKGPSITPRPPQGQPVVTALAHARLPYEFAASSADVVYVTPRSAEDARAIVEEVRKLSGELKIFADLLVFLGEDAARRKARLDELDGAELVSDAAIFAGTPAELAEVLLEWRRAGIQGFRLRPGTLPYDLTRITRELTAELRGRGAFRHEYEATTLRGLLGLPHPASRYAEVS
ncbi:Flavin-dependent oxidoreductase, luciferase family (includes alkanesulfonate monooxygenase SsuD and methylene tetrahydromethanopterin reductase) [Nonomuraea solani]|uniref:Flavin-dependent oxidoreductase, luciferase family (Includes alkanesulfonate monooxygenase SsuD and methylene tetrahydromethanopterin reductase) n=1 Tax=Nonomuraea solani TaxID=1144553 RepID=A0A1H6EM76_9ACTN|nr:LLM class flavin-dependent oxidoreductase [Nonomuraea solani]SEG97864.1 Flavin-dependent oxidoreductase, luciferase family (includes alkanesulfonate monooxygenase SsuD and methylene tetrahydromethanopterin reductase) [Nonomuraea solani]